MNRSSPTNPFFSPLAAIFEYHTQMGTIAVAVSMADTTEMTARAAERGFAFLRHEMNVPPRFITQQSCAENRKSQRAC